MNKIVETPVFQSRFNIGDIKNEGESFSQSLSTPNFNGIGYYVHAIKVNNVP
jgi:hypothetical protein